MWHDHLPCDWGELFTLEESSEISTWICLKLGEKCDRNCDVSVIVKLRLSPGRKF